MLVRDVQSDIVLGVVSTVCFLGLLILAKCFELEDRAILISVIRKVGATINFRIVGLLNIILQ